MPKKYTETEKANIRADLIAQAERSLFYRGVKGTSVDDLVRSVSIPKGTFYLFYESKEALYFDVLRSFRLEMQEGMLSMLQELDENHIVTSLTTVFFHLLKNIYERGIYRLFDEETMMLVSRKSEGDIYKEELAQLVSFFRELFGYFAIDDSDDIASFCDAFLMIVYSMPGGVRMNEPLKCWKLLLRGLVLQLVGE